LYGFSLSLDSSDFGGLDSTSIIHGIYIEPGIKNTKIISSAPHETKGSIIGFTGYGILAEGFDEQTNSNSEIFINKVKQIEIDNLLIAENFNGICLDNVFQANINKSSIINNHSTSDAYGIYCLDSHDITINECKVNKNSSERNILGLCIQDCVGTSILHSEANYNESLLYGNAIGMQITGTTCHANTIFNSQASANLCAHINSSESIGFHITNQAYNNVIEKCNTHSNKSMIPFPSQPTPTITPVGYGIKLENSNHNQIHENTSSTQKNYGFYDALIGSTTIYTGNKSLYNPTANYSIFFTTGTDATEPLPTTIIYPGDLLALLGSATTSPLINIEIKAALTE
jgi:hypothetical protein